MAGIISSNELVRRAIIYIDEMLASEPGLDRRKLLEETGMRFNLGPRDAMDLERLFLERDSGNAAAGGRITGAGEQLES